MKTLVNEKTLTSIMTDKRYNYITQKEAFNSILEILVNAKFKGQLYLNDSYEIKFNHYLRVEDYLSSSSSWFIRIPEKNNHTYDSKVSYVQDLLEEDDKVIQWIVNEVNDVLLTPEDRKLFWDVYVMKYNRTRVIENNQIYKKKYYQDLETIFDVVSYQWCVAPGKAAKYREYVSKTFEILKSHNVSPL